MALGLLGLKPWEWERCSVGDVEMMIAGAVRRWLHLYDLAAVVSARLMAATGNYPRGQEPTVHRLLGRDPLPFDPRGDEAEPGEAAPIEAHLLAAAGFGVSGRMTAEEMAQAHAEAHAS